MTPDMLDEAVVDLAILAAFLLILAAGGFIADYVFPHIPFIERFIDSLPNWDNEN